MLLLMPTGRDAAETEARNHGRMPTWKYRRPVLHRTCRRAIPCGQPLRRSAQASGRLLQNAGMDGRDFLAIPATEYRRTRWRNGRGWTREILALPDNDAWDLRLSIAEVDAAAEPGLDATAPTRPFDPTRQHTLAQGVTVNGKGLLIGQDAVVIIKPAPANHGIVFVRTDLKGAPRVPANFEAVVSTHMATTLGSTQDGTPLVGTVEHLMAALYSLGVTNLLVEMKGTEIPILDGSALGFIEAIEDAGIIPQHFTACIYLKR